MGFGSNSDIYDDLYSRGKLGGSGGTPKPPPESPSTILCKQLQKLYDEDGVPISTILAHVRTHKPEHYVAVRNYFWSREDPEWNYTSPEEYPEEVFEEEYEWEDEDEDEDEEEDEWDRDAYYDSLGD